MSKNYRICFSFEKQIGLGGGGGGEEGDSSLKYEWLVPHLRLLKHPNRIGGVMVSVLAYDAILHLHDDLLFVNLFCYYALLYLK